MTGRAGSCSRRRRGAERLACPAPAPRLRPLLQLILGLCCGAHLGHCQVPAASPPPQCRIQKCTGDFVTLTSHLTPALDGFDTEFCKGLRAYSSCTQRTAKSCRGNLVFHSAVLGISDLMSQRNCSRDGPTSATHPEEPLPEPCDYHSRMQHAHAHAHTHAHMHAHTHGHGHGHGHGHTHGGGQAPLSDVPPGYLFCGLFGDPHLRTFRDSFQTCKVEGAWPLIDNRFLSVQVTNVPVVTGSSATATNKITIIFKPYEACTEQRVYQAVTDNLPAAFDDGTVSSDPSFFSSSSSSSSSSSLGEESSPSSVASASTSSDGKLRALWIRERSPGRHVELHARYIGVTVVVRQLGRYLTLAVRIPEELALTYDPMQDLQLCLNGCPSAERIDRGQGHLPLPLPPMAASPPALGLQAQRGRSDPGAASPRGFSVEGARDRCKEQLEDEDIYFHSCMFDLLTTGDANFTAAAHSALKDMESLHPHKDRWRIYPRSSAPPAATTSRPMAERLTALTLLLCAALF